MTVSLWISVAEAARRGIDELVDEFAALAESLGGDLVDDSETIGSWEWFEFSGMSAAQVEMLATQIFPDYRSIEYRPQGPGGVDQPGPHLFLTV